MTQEQIEIVVYEWSIESAVTLSKEQFDDLVGRLALESDHTLQ